MNKKEIGNIYETKAAQYLIDLGYVILERNYYWKHLEIDIIAYDSNTKDLVFVEVKYRKNNNFGGAEAAITKDKIKNLRTAALVYMKKHRIKIDSYIRFDCILITGNNINHVKNAW